MNGDIEIEIGTDEARGGFAVQVIRSVGGGLPRGRLELDAAGILDQLGQLENTVLASAVGRRGLVSTAEQPLRDVGARLFEALFAGSVYGSYRASLGAVQQRGERLRVVLRLTAPELAALPWEAMFDPERGAYLCRTEPLVRRVDAPYTPDPLRVEPPLHILGLVAGPRGLPPLDAEAERHNLEAALARPLAGGLVELTWAPDASWETIHDLMLDGAWHILHFVGHGDYDPTTDEGVLALVGPGGRADMVEASRLTDLLSEAEPTPRLVVLNSCSSGTSGSSDLFAGTAAALVHRGISAAAAMQFSITDAAAVKFARGFYAALARGRGVDEAMRSGRIEILGAAGSLEWITPVLYVRGDTNRLFDMVAAGSARAVPGPAPRPQAEVVDAVAAEPRAASEAQSHDRAGALPDKGVRTDDARRTPRTVDRTPGTVDRTPSIRSVSRILADRILAPSDLATVADVVYGLRSPRPDAVEAFRLNLSSQEITDVVGVPGGFHMAASSGGVVVTDQKHVTTLDPQLRQTGQWRAADGSTVLHVEATRNCAWALVCGPLTDVWPRMSKGKQFEVSLVRIELATGAVTVFAPYTDTFWMSPSTFRGAQLQGTAGVDGTEVVALRCEWAASGLTVTKNKVASFAREGSDELSTWPVATTSWSSPSADPRQVLRWNDHTLLAYWAAGESKSRAALARSDGELASPILLREFQGPLAQWLPSPSGAVVAAGTAVQWELWRLTPDGGELRHCATVSGDLRCGSVSFFDLARELRIGFASESGRLWLGIVEPSGILCLAEDNAVTRLDHPGNPTVVGASTGQVHVLVESPEAGQFELRTMVV